MCRFLCMYTYTCIWYRQNKKLELVSWSTADHWIYLKPSWFLCVENFRNQFLGDVVDCNGCGGVRYFKSRANFSGLPRGRLIVKSNSEGSCFLFFYLFFLCFIYLFVFLFLLFQFFPPPMSSLTKNIAVGLCLKIQSPWSVNFGRICSDIGKWNQWIK